MKTLDVKIVIKSDSDFVFYGEEAVFGVFEGEVSAEGGVREKDGGFAWRGWGEGVF